MNTFVVDTHKTVKMLVAKGFTQEQAEGVVDALAQSDVLTKDYFEARLYRALLLHGLGVVGAILGGAVLIAGVM